MFFMSLCTLTIFSKHEMKPRRTELGTSCPETEAFKTALTFDSACWMVAIASLETNPSTSRGARDQSINMTWINRCSRFIGCKRPTTTNQQEKGQEEVKKKAVKIHPASNQGQPGSCQLIIGLSVSLNTGCVRSGITCEGKRSFRCTQKRRFVLLPLEQKRGGWVRVARSIV